MQSKNWELTAEIANNLLFSSKGLVIFRRCFAKISEKCEASLQNSAQKVHFPAAFVAHLEKK